MKNKKNFREANIIKQMTLPFAANKVAPSPTKINKPDNTKNRATSKQQ